MTNPTPLESDVNKNTNSVDIGFKDVNDLQEDEELRKWAATLGWRWDASCKWFAIDLHENGGGPLTTVLNEKAMRLFKAHSEQKALELISTPPTYKAKTLDGRDVEGYYVKHINATPYPIATKEEHQRFLDEHTEHVIMMDEFSDWGLPRNAKPYRIDITTLEPVEAHNE